MLLQPDALLTLNLQLGVAVGGRPIHGNMAFKMGTGFRLSNTHRLPIRGDQVVAGPESVDESGH